MEAILLYPKLIRFCRWRIANPLRLYEAVAGERDIAAFGRASKSLCTEEKL